MSYNTINQVILKVQDLRRLLEYLQVINDFKQEKWNSFIGIVRMKLIDFWIKIIQSHLSTLRNTLKIYLSFIKTGVVLFFAQFYICAI